MSPREPYGDKPMSSAERVRRSRWVNNLENTAYKLLDLINEAPEQLPRQPSIPAELVEKIKAFINTDIVPEQSNIDPSIRVLKLGNGNQVKNKKLALEFIAKHFNKAQVIDKRTISIPQWGNCHVSAYTHPKGAMISTPNKNDQDYGGTEWHKNEHIILFRDVGDGRCKIYINKIEPLFNYRTIGHHGVLWKKIEELSEKTEILNSCDVNAILRH